MNEATGKRNSPMKPSPSADQAGANPAVTNLTPIYSSEYWEATETTGFNIEENAIYLTAEEFEITGDVLDQSFQALMQDYKENAMKRINTYFPMYKVGYVFKEAQEIRHLFLVH